MILTRKILLAATAGVLAIASSPGFAQSTPADEPEGGSPERASVTYLDLTLGGGYSTNPFLRTVDSEGSAFGRASARGVHAWNTETSRTSIAGFVEGSTYFNDYGLESIFSVTGDTSHQVSETVTVFGSAGVSGDLSGQLSNRFLYVPPVPQVPDTNIPPPPPVTVQDPDLFAFTDRQYRIYGQVGTSIRTSPNTSIGVSGGASRSLFDNPALDDYTSYFGTLSYNRALSERTTIGVSVSANQTQYDGGTEQTTVYNPAFNISTQLSEFWEASASIGVSFADIDSQFFNGNSTNLSFDGSLCRSGDTERLCMHIARYAQNSASSSFFTTTSAGVDWYKQLTDKDTIQLSASVVRYIGEEDIDEIDGDTHHFRLAANYSREIGDRLSAGADVGVRSLWREGPDPDTDLSGSFFLRYRLGDLE